MWPLVTQNLESGDEYSAPEEPADQSQPATPDAVGDAFPLGRGSSGARVVQLQEWLMAAGFDVGASGADGHLGPATQAAVTAWQTANGLAGTGILTADQWPLLESSSQGESAETAVAPVAGEPVVVVTTTNHNQATEAFVVGASGAVRPLPGIDPMGEVGGIAISTDSTTIYRAIDGTLTSIDALTLATTASVACGECRDLLVLGDGGVATVDGVTLHGFGPDLSVAFERPLPPPADATAPTTSVIHVFGDPATGDLLIATPSPDGATSALARVDGDGSTRWTLDAPIDPQPGIAVSADGSHVAGVRPIATDDAADDVCRSGGDVVMIDAVSGQVAAVPLDVVTVGGATRRSSPTGLRFAGDTLYATHPQPALGADSEIRFGCDDFAAHTAWSLAAGTITWTALDVQLDDVSSVAPTGPTSSVMTVDEGGTQGTISVLVVSSGDVVATLNGSQDVVMPSLIEDHPEALPIVAD